MIHCEDTILLTNDGGPVDDDYLNENGINLSNLCEDENDGWPNISTVDQSASDPSPSPLCPGNSRCSLVVRSALIAATGGLLFGYDVGIVGGALLQLRRQLMLSCAQSEAVVSVMLAGALLASLLGGVIVDSAGRKVSIIMTAILFVMGAAILSLAANFPVLLLGRFVIGFAVSLSAVGECVYISELSPDSRRGQLVSLNELAITVGFLLSYLSAYLLISVENGWRFMFGVAAIPALFQTIAMFFMPKTPHFLLLQRKDKQAEKVLQQLHGRKDVKQRLTHVRLSVNDSQQRAPLCCGEVTTGDGVMVESVVTGVGLVLLQQFTGQPSLLNYAPLVLQMMGICADSAATMATVGLGVVKLLATAAVLIFVDRWGRRRFLLLGTCAMFVCLLIMASVTSLQDKMASSAAISSGVCSDYRAEEENGERNSTSNKISIKRNTLLNKSTPQSNTSASTSVLITGSSVAHYSNNSGDVVRDLCSADSLSSGQQLSGLPLVALVSLMGYVAGYAVGFGPITWLVLSELFPPAVKGRAVAAAGCVNWLANMLVSGVLLQSVEFLSLSGLFLIYAAVSLFACLFVFFVVPETSRKSLHEISQEIKKRGFFMRARGHVTCFCCHDNDSGAISSYSQLDINQHQQQC